MPTIEWLEKVVLNSQSRFRSNWAQCGHHLKACGLQLWLFKQHWAPLQQLCKPGIFKCRNVPSRASNQIRTPSLHPARIYEKGWLHIGQRLRQWVFPKVPKQEILVHDVCSGWKSPSGHVWVSWCCQMRSRHQVHSLLAITVGSRLVQPVPPRKPK